MDVKPGYKLSEVGVIPADWESIKLGLLASFTSGEGIAVSQLHKNSSYNFVPVFGGNGIAGYTTRSMISEPTVIVGRVGQKCGEVYLTNGPSWVTDNALYPRTLSRRVTVQYLAIALRVAGLNSVKNRNDLPLVTQAILDNFVISLPPTQAEQQAIAGALSDADALIESLQQLVAKKRQIKHGAMQELLTGRKRLPGFSGEWETKCFGEIAQLRMERVDPRRSGPYEFCLELEHIEPATGRQVAHSATTQMSSLKSVFRPHDVLFGKLRAYLRKFWMADRAGVCSTEIWVITPRSGLLDPRFLFHTVTVDRFIEAASTAYGTHMPRSDWNVVKNYEVAFPPLIEQQAIAAILSDLDAEISALDSKLAKARQLKQGMMQELLTGRVRLV